MSEAKFRVGDRVRVVLGHDHLLPLGAVRVVRNVSGSYLDIEDANGKVECWLASRFEKVEEPLDVTRQLADLFAAFNAIGPRARDVLVAVAQRLVKGAKEHGDFETDRNWTREALEEDLDALVYRTIEALKRAGMWK